MVTFSHIGNHFVLLNKSQENQRGQNSTPHLLHLEVQRSPYVNVTSCETLTLRVMFDTSLYIDLIVKSC